MRMKPGYGPGTVPCIRGAELARMLLKTYRPLLPTSMKARTRKKPRMVAQDAAVMRRLVRHPTLVRFYRRFAWFIIPLLCLFRLYRIYQGGMTNKENHLDFYKAVHELCHTDGFVNYTMFAPGTLSQDNCYSKGNGTLEHESVEFLERGVELPSVSEQVLRRCRENPYHAFYDCIWPLVHYLAVCSDARSPPAVVLPPGSLQVTENGTWADGALGALLNGLVGRGVRIIRPHLEQRSVCFTHITGFNDGEWRPPRWGAQIGDSAHMHPETDVASGMRLFRTVVLEGLGVNWDDEPISGYVLVYDRGDARRRRWASGFDFAVALNRTGVRTMYAWKMPSSFREQAVLHAGARALIAPHGAAFANSLFMRDGGIVLEVASRNCSEIDDVPTDVRALGDTTRADAWTAWHASRVGLRYTAVPCTIVRERGRTLAADVQALLRLASALLAVQERAFGSS